MKEDNIEEICEKTEISKSDEKENEYLKNEVREADLEFKRMQISEKKIQIENWENRKIKKDEDEVLISKIMILRFLLTSTVPDEGSSQFDNIEKKKLVFSEDESWIIKDKLFRIIEKL